ncbi:hypothetical protein [Bradyrhizobium symbiodeficiens]|uniref:Uncharacterized protein n=1 Tax=Bradyrhizobium symbiodeficiens TaxID=1404367 RepID=A0A6G9A895_9BRAD|nr:hypothetical protein [Bradyrhizobium symbiodeficiens]QIP08525.1 hypothetical protein HAV00_20690 [Bradyrhizobium symbiodeficiens]
MRPSTPFRPSGNIVPALPQADGALTAHQAQLQQQKAQNDAIHLHVETQGAIELTEIKAAFDAKMTLRRPNNERETNV